MSALSDGFDQDCSLTAEILQDFTLLWTVYGDDNDIMITMMTK